jgi:hypothetical protein
MSALAELKKENKQLKLLLKKAIALLKQSKILLKPVASKPRTRSKSARKAAKR